MEQNISQHFNAGEMIRMPDFLGNLREKKVTSNFSEQLFNDPMSFKSFQWKNSSKYISKIIRSLID